MIIAIDSSNEDLAGAIVYWRLTGDVNADDLNNALQACGLEDHTLRLPSPRKALRRALSEYARAEVFMRAGKGQDAGLYLVRQQPAAAAGEEPEFDVWVRGGLNIAGQPQIEILGETPIDPDKLRDGIRNRYWHHVFHVAATDISSWLISQAAECDAVSLRDTGGVYFVPRHALDEWRRRADALHEQTACHVYMIPAMNSDEAIDAVIQSVLDEAQAFSDQLQDDLVDEELGPRALEGRAEKAKALLAKLGRYENLLGDIAARKLATVREQVEAQQANAVAASLAAMSEGVA